MKFQRIEFRSFGPFSGEALDLSGKDKNFHLIYGQNEAGKSTALRGVNGLLFGIPMHTQDAHLHEPRDLRIAAELERDDGTVFKFVRRKGNERTILDEQENPLSDELLRACLANASKDVFTNLFSMDHESLRNHGQELLSGKGSLGELLYQAGTGISNLHALLLELEEEANALFRARSRTSVIKTAIDQYAEARGKSQKTAIQPRNWIEREEALKQKEKELAEVKKALGELATSNERLKRIQIALPRALRRKNIIVELAGLGPVENLIDEALAKTKAELEVRKRALSNETARTETIIMELQEKLQNLPNNKALLERKSLISSGFQKVENYRNAKRDYPLVKAEQAHFENQAKLCLLELGADCPLHQATKLAVLTAVKAKVQALGKRYSQLLHNLKSAASAVEGLREKLQAKQREFEAVPEVAETDAMEEALEGVKKEGNLEAQLQEATRQLAEVAHKSDVQLERLRFWHGSLEALEKLSIPALEVITRHETELSSLKHRKQLAEAESRANFEKKVRAERDIHSLVNEAAIPTEDDLRIARERRDFGWNLVQRAWQTGKAGSSVSEQFSKDVGLATAYERSVADADQVADRLRREADRVAKLASSRAELTLCEATELHLQTVAAGINSEVSALETNWKEAWSSAGIVPGSAAEMRAFVGDHATLCTMAMEVRQRSSKVADLQALISRHKKRLSEVFRVSGNLPGNEEENLGSLLIRGQQHLARIDDLKRTKEILKEQTVDLSNDLATAGRTHTQSQHELTEWQNEWEPLMPLLRLHKTATPDEVNAVLDKTNVLLKHLEDAANRGARVDAMLKAITEFETDAKILAEEISPGLLNRPADVVLLELQDKLSNAQEDETRRRDLAEQLEKEKSRHKNAQAEISRLEVELLQILKKAHCSNFEEFDQLARKSVEVRNGRSKLLEQDQLLSESAAGTLLPEFLEALDKINPDTIQHELNELNSKQGLLDDRRSSLDGDIAKETEALKLLSNSEESITAAEDAQSWLGTIRTQTKRYVQLKLAADVLRRQMERYREQNQGPILGRASEIFPRLTLGSFSRLKTGFDDKDHPVLLGVRPTGTEVEISGMSDGTRDQLFLSLKLASLEKQLSESEPLPLVIDDILINFDDRRSEATLKELANISMKTQVLFFTHHQRLVEIAEKSIGSDLKVHHLRKQ